MRVVFLKVAQSEFDKAIAYYESEKPGLGSRFRHEVLRTINRIADYPTASEPLSKRSRRCLVAKFPYGIIYQYDPRANKILVIAVAHLHRKSDYWLSRSG